MNQQPTFSIITITYNAERWLERTILSVLSQSYPNIEYILIDGASKDKTVEIIKQYESGIASWISEPDKGLYDAMNKGIEAGYGGLCVVPECGGYTLYRRYRAKNCGVFEKESIFARRDLRRDPDR